MDMFSLFNYLNDANEKEIKSEYEYLVLFIHVYIVDEFKLKVRSFFWIKDCLLIDCFFSFQDGGQNPLIIICWLSSFQDAV